MPKQKHTETKIFDRCIVLTDPDILVARIQVHIVTQGEALVASSEYISYTDFETIIDGYKLVTERLAQVLLESPMEVGCIADPSAGGTL